MMPSNPFSICLTLGFTVLGIAILMLVISIYNRIEILGEIGMFLNVFAMAVFITNLIHSRLKE